MGAFIDLTGNRFGRLTVIMFSGTLRNRKAWECKCDCGAMKIVTSNDLRRGIVSSCGCLRREMSAAKSKQAGDKRGEQLQKHGLARTRLYNVWKSMRGRCNNPNSIDYPEYGKRGIKVCDEWNDFQTFHDWAMNNGYIEDALFGKCTIDRIDVNSGYEPDNCRFVNLQIQANNRRPRRKRSEMNAVY